MRGFIRFDESLQKIINEERGISTELQNLTYDIYDKIADEIKSNKISMFYSNDIRYKSGEFSYDNFLGRTIKIKYHYYNFISSEAYRLKCDKINYICRAINDYAVEITVYAISGTIQKVNLLESLVHELEHLYQYNKAGKVFSANEVYEYALKLKKECGKWTLPYCIGDAIYLSRRYEQDAYMNGLYTKLMNCEFPSDFDEVFHNSDIYHALKRLKFYLGEIKKCKSFPTRLQSVGYTHHKFVKECTKAIDDIQRKMARTYNKALDDYRKKNPLTEKEFFSIKDTF